MIGVAINIEEREIVREFFELFKTPWEFYRPEAQYEAVLFARRDASARGVTANLVIVYASQETPFDKQEEIEIICHRSTGTLCYRESRLPLYGDNITFRDKGVSILRDENSQQSAGLLVKSGHKVLVRIGYDLFREFRVLLTNGQPAENASIPTLEVHIALLRDLIVESGIRLVEIPPIPEGHTFIACLTHDVDHPLIRQHRWDHTIFGFLYRAIFGSLFSMLKGRASLRHLLTNWAAAAKLPFIYLGLAKDFWSEFDRYLEIENGLDSTFFVLPFKDRPGKTALGLAPRIRASGYGAVDIAARLQAFVSVGREVGLHGIDAWIDSTKGLEEKTQITNITGAKNIGVRMHWLYFDENSPRELERAGFTYDSTIGYNETIGYRVGTGQVYKPLQADHLLELPLHVMDTALFYPSYLNLSVVEANRQVGLMIDSAIQFGGAITFNWHDRSIAPERLWGEFYTSLINKLKQKGGWCTSAGGVVSWFHDRRSVVFTRADQGLEVARRGISLDPRKDAPGLRLRVYNARRGGDNSSEPHLDLAFSGNMTICLDRHSLAIHG